MNSKSIASLFLANWANKKSSLFCLHSFHIQNSLFLFFLFSLLTFSSYGQDALSHFSVVIEPTERVEFSPLASQEEINTALDTTDQRVTFVVHLQEASATKIHVKFGTSANNWNKFDGVLNIDATNLPAGITIEKNENVLRIKIGVFDHLSHYAAQVKVELAGGEFSRVYEVKK